MMGMMGFFLILFGFIITCIFFAFWKFVNRLSKSLFLCLICINFLVAAIFLVSIIFLFSDHRPFYAFILDGLKPLIIDTALFFFIFLPASIAGGLALLDSTSAQIASDVAPPSLNENDP